MTTTVAPEVASDNGGKSVFSFGNIDLEDIYSTPTSKMIPPDNTMAPKRMDLLRPRVPNLPSARMPPLSAFDGGAPTNVFNETYKIYNLTAPSYTNPTSTASTYLSGALNVQNDGIKKVRREMEQMQEMLGNKIKMQEEELRTLRSKHVQFKGVDTSKGAKSAKSNK